MCFAEIGIRLSEPLAVLVQAEEKFTTHLRMAQRWLKNMMSLRAN